MREVFVRHASGAGVVRREDEWVLVSGDVDEDGAAVGIRREDRYHPAKSSVDEERSVVGGWLPPDAVSAEVVDDRGARVLAEVANGAYVAVIDQPNDGHEPIVCCRDTSGRPVRRPWAAEYPSVRVADAEEACPACGAMVWDEYVPFEEWRAGRGSKVDGTHEASPVVSCRVCGHEETEGVFFAMRSAPPDSESEEERRVRMAQVRAELLKRRWLSDSLTLRAADFPIYAAEDWTARLGGSDSQGDRLTEITIRHFTSADDADPIDGADATMAVVTRREDRLRFSALMVARDALEGWVRRGESGEWPDASHAAVTLFLRARDRAARGAVLAADRAHATITVDGTPTDVLLLSVADGPWAAAFRHADLTITASGRDVDPSSIRLEPIPNPVEALLGPAPPDA